MINARVFALVSFLCLVCTLTKAGQSGGANLPCNYSGELLRDTNGEVVRFGSDEMKRRATHKVEIGDFMKKTDIKGTAIIDVLVGRSGEVVCAKPLLGHPILRSEVEKAIRAWTFKPERVNEDAVAYLGRMEFHLCNTSCGDQGISMSIAK